MSPVPRLTQVGPHTLSFAALCALAGLVVLSALCTFCKRRRRKKKNLVSDGVLLVDVSLLRQTQLRSLSKSDTKLNELHSIRFKETNRRPLSMDYLYSTTSGRARVQLGPGDHHVSSKRVLPNIPHADLRGEWRNPNHTYSNPKSGLEPQPIKSATETDGKGAANADPKTEPPPSVTRSQEVTTAITAEYACVKKQRKNVPTEPQEHGKQAPPRDGSSFPGDSAALPPGGQALKLEEMYSTVCKRGKKKPQDPAPLAEENIAPEGASHTPAVEIQSISPPGNGLPHHDMNREWVRLRCPDPFVEEPAYETIDMPWVKEDREGRAERKCLNENLYESINEAREAQPSGSARTIKTNNEFEVYLTGL
ncbi:lck-interacting transmembrane adapter 1 [Ambystoma mexicanum]|uniref:lck-interacting transmembrane adapter 1 n=1 Tax=Ambystoma mexicanum TaxID=8296 RepID=UPI0037E98A94